MPTPGGIVKFIPVFVVLVVWFIGHLKKIDNEHETFVGTTFFSCGNGLVFKGRFNTFYLLGMVVLYVILFSKVFF